MRKHRAPLGWPRRDPRHYRFALPNAIWRHKLKPKVFAVLCYMVYWQRHGNGVLLTVEQIMSTLHMSKKVATKNLDALRLLPPWSQAHWQ